MAMTWKFQNKGVKDSKNNFLIFWGRFVKSEKKRGYVWISTKIWEKKLIVRFENDSKFLVRWGYFNLCGRFAILSVRLSKDW